MNIFFVDQNPMAAAQALYDTHVCAMVRESAQMLSTAHRVLGESHDALCKITHRNHPCSLWVRTSVDNYYWLFDHFVGLLDEYTLRYSKQHMYTRLWPLLMCPPHGITQQGFTEPAQTMPNDCKGPDPVVAYRTCYATHKRHLYRYTRRAEPSWLAEYMF